MKSEQISEQLGVPLSPEDIEAVESLEEYFKDKPWFHDIQCNPKSKELTVRADLTKDLFNEVVDSVFALGDWKGYRLFFFQWKVQLISILSYG